MSRGAPVERFTLTVRQTTTSFVRQELFFHAQGAFALHDLPAGAYQVQADTPDGTATTDVTLAEGEQKTGVALALTLRGAVDGLLVELESGAPIAGARLRVDGSSNVAIMSGDDRTYRSGADGHFHLEGVLAGTWSLTVTPSDRAFGMARVPVVVQDGGGTSDVGNIRLPRRRVGPGEQAGDVGILIGQGDGAPQVAVVFGPGGGRRDPDRRRDHLGRRLRRPAPEPVPVRAARDRGRRPRGERRPRARGDDQRRRARTDIAGALSAGGPSSRSNAAARASVA